MAATVAIEFGKPGAPEALAGGEERNRLQKVGLASAVGAEEHNRPRPDLKVEGGTANGAPTAVVVGKCAAIWEGEEIKANGKWIRHPQHGLQFNAESIACVVPSSLEGIRRYLASGMIRGVGKVYAKKIVEHFGPQTLEIIDKNSARLLEVPGIGKDRKRKIKESWDAQHGIRDAMIFLQANGVGTAQASRIFRI